jgi:threonine aldolase
MEERMNNKVGFSCDYHEGAHPRLLNKLIETNMVQTSGYGIDPYCEEAQDIIKGLCGNADLSVHFIVGGTLANLIVIAATLRTHQCVISPTTGHINVQETGATESTGHKILTIPETNGKIFAAQIDEVCQEYWQSSGNVHTAQPKLVYITHSTEFGTLYSRAEMQAIRDVCDKYRLYLYLDGARLGYGLTAEGNDIDLKFIAECCDVFYVGGGKQGALLGEAIVIRNKDIATDFRPIMKQHGGLLAKGRVLGIQFKELFCDGLFFDISVHANKMASMIRACLKRCNINFLIENTTNLLFPILPNSLFETLSVKYSFSYQKKWDSASSVVRIATSWATREEDVNKLIYDIEAFYKNPWP